ncbi:Epl1 protein [Zopfochytrium polystomum]|nr:Epl1 protein [Zopfochytrium polystomum]
MYDNKNLPLGGLNCADTYRSYPTLGAIPVKPYVYFAASSDLSGVWNSPKCGSCYYTLYYQAKTIFVVAVDACGDGFVVGVNVLNGLTDNKAFELGSITAEATLVPSNQCF